MRRLMPLTNEPHDAPLDLVMQGERLRPMWRCVLPAWDRLHTASCKCPPSPLFFCNFCCAEVPHPIQCDVDQHVLATHACVACQTARSPMYRLCLLCGIPCSHALSTVLCTRCVNPFRILTTEVRTSACALNLSPRTLSITATLCRFWRT